MTNPDLFQDAASATQTAKAEDLARRLATVEAALLDFQARLPGLAREVAAIAQEMKSGIVANNPNQRAPQGPSAPQ